MINILTDAGDISLRRILPGSALRDVTLAQVQAGAQPFAFAGYSIANHVRAGLQEFLRRVPDAVLDAARAGRVGLILDNSGEANEISDAVFDDWYGAIAALGLDPARLAYVSQDVGLAGLHRRYLQQSGRAAGITIGYHHFFLRKLVADSRAAVPDEAAFAARQARVRAAPAPRYRALCLMHKVRPRRVQLALELIRHGMWDETLISFGGLDADDIRRQRRRAAFGRPQGSALAGFRHTVRAAEAEALAPHVPQLRSYGRVLLDTVDPLDGRGYGASSHMVFDLGEAHHLAARFSMVSETEMLARQFRLTEKCAKPLANHHAGVIFGNPFTLELLQRLGFQSFGAALDESYDSIADPDARFAAAFAETRRLWSMDPAEWHDTVTRLRPVLDHNARHFFFGLDRVLYETMDAPLIDRLLRLQTPLAERGQDAGQP
jgi:hypothetical protein